MPPKRVVPSAPKPTTPTVTKIDDTNGSVSYTLSITKSIGSYEFVKVEVGVQLPLDTDTNTLTKVDELMTIAKTKVTEVVGAELDEILDSLKPNK